MSQACPRCSEALTPAADVGPGVLSCTCGSFFVSGPAREKLLAWLRIEDGIWSMILSQGKRGPTCACGARMQTSSLKGVAIDGCPTCGGLLLDPGELRTLTGLEERPGAAPAARHASAPAADASALGRVYLPSRQALDAFVGSSRSFRLAQSVGSVGGDILGVAVNQPFQWTLQGGMATASIGPADDSVARQLLAFVTRNVVSSRFLLRDGRDNPMLVFVRHTKALVSARVDVLHGDDEARLGSVERSVIGLALDVTDAGGRAALRFEKQLGDIWGFTIVDPQKRKIGDVSRNFANLTADVSLLGGIGVERSVRRDDFDIAFEEGVSVEARALALAAAFLVAHTSNGPAGLTALFN